MIPIVLIGLNVLWIYLFAILLRNRYRTPSIEQCSLTRAKPATNTFTHVNNLSLHSSENLPAVSIIIPARNEQENIERCLRSLLNQNYPNFEIIVIDDNSTDSTLKILYEIQNSITSENEKLMFQHHVQLQNAPQLVNQNSNTLSIDSNMLTSVEGLQIEGSTTPTSAENESKSINHINHNKMSKDRLKIISLKEDGPRGWTGKTWASQQGYLCSNGHILIFTDADTCYINQDTINSSVSYFQNDNLDVLTGFPFVELRDFWSKMVNPVWKLIGTLFGYTLSDINNPKSDAANLMGCFIVIKRKTFEEIGTYKTIRNSIREDEALGIRAKKMGYRIRAAQMDKSLTALWSKNLQTLWSGIARTIVPDLLNVNGKKKEKVIYDLLTIFLMAVLPFVILPYSLNKAPSSAFDYYIIDNFYSSNSVQVQSRLINQIHLIILLMNLSACVALFAGSAANAILKFKISPMYAFMAPIGAIFLLVAYITNIISSIIQSKKLRNVVWRDRNICLNNKQY